MTSLKYAGLVLCLTGISHAAVGVFGFWRLGENDPGAAAGNFAGATTLDASGGGNTLSLVGSPAPIYTITTPKNSTLAMSFTGSSNWSGPAVLTPANNFAIEIWAYPTSSGGNRAVIYNGNTGTAGYGIYQLGSNWGVLYGGVVAASVTPVILNQYTDLALVRDAGVTTLYVNGTAFPLALAAPNAVSGNMLIGANQAGTERFVGLLDEGRLSTFNSPFDPTTLFINQPASGSPGPATGVPAVGTVSMAIAIFCMAGLAFYALRTRFAE